MKRTKRNKGTPLETKHTATQSYHERPITWTFDRVDMDGEFAFDLNRIEENEHVREILEKQVSFSKMSWQEIKTATHDAKGKSKHHNLEIESLSAEAKRRIEKLQLSEDDRDSIFSFALQNKLRIVGIKEEPFFHVLWYDPEHKVCPSKR